MAQDDGFVGAIGADNAIARRQSATALANSEQALDKVDRLGGMLETLDTRTHEHGLQLAELKTNVGQLQGDVGQLHKVMSSTATKLLGAAAAIATTVLGGGYLATQRVTEQSREQAAAVATTVAREDTDDRLRRLMREAVAEGRSERDRELEAARIAEQRRIVAAERAAQQRDPDEGEARANRLMTR